MPPGSQAEFVLCCEEVGCILIFGLDCVVRLVSLDSPAGPDAYPLTSTSSADRTFRVPACYQVQLVPV